MGSAWWYTRFKPLSILRADFSLFRATFLALGRDFKKSDTVSLRCVFLGLTEDEGNVSEDGGGVGARDGVSSIKVEVMSERKVEIGKEGTEKRKAREVARAKREKGKRESSGVRPLVKFWVYRF